MNKSSWRGFCSGFAQGMKYLWPGFLVVFVLACLKIAGYTVATWAVAIAVLAAFGWAMVEVLDYSKKHKLRQ